MSSDTRRLLVVLISGVTALAACTTPVTSKQPRTEQAVVTPPGTTASGGSARAGSGGRTTAPPGPVTLPPFPGTPSYAGAGVWRPAGRLVGGKAAVYQTLLVIYDSGSVTVGAWGTDVTMTPSVAAVRQNLFPLVANGQPTARASTRTWRVWGGTCPCGAGLIGTYRGPATFFDPAYGRDFITMSASPVPGRR